ncbi:MAG: tRNA 2-thiouridine(34) synthase MnmA [Sandaracinus sp.]|nr:tRNA 2-thiouridine(34) synthase MnmA [Sandaracinus sp.]
MIPGPGRVLVALSGGVDSSVAAGLLHEAGHDLVGVTMHLWDAQGQSQVGRCCAPEDREDARRTCDHLGIPHYVLDERESFRSEVVEPFLDAYAAGQTPSPCVHCNRTVKLLQLAALADRLGCTWIATGHYARIERDAEGLHLLRGVDHGKDQSYFLYGVPREVLDRLVLPLGGRSKDATREEGRRLGLPNADKPDSQELCFVPDGDVRGFVARERGEVHPGRIVDEAGKELGRHEGIEGLTVGQRKGLQLGGQDRPRYVLKIVPDTGDVVVGDEASLLGREVRVEDARWVRARREPFEALVRIRYRHTPAPARVEPFDGGFHVRFHEPQRAITAGQAAVVYVGDEVLGGGFITSV